MSQNNDASAGLSDSKYLEKGKFTEKDIMNMTHQQVITDIEILYEGRSLYQDIIVCSTKKFGNILILDGAIQCSELEEFVYQEMLTFLPLNSHPKPSKVLVLGGGDGGVLRQIDMHPLVDSAVLCEIDEVVLKVSRMYLKDMAVGLDSPKAKVVIQDAYEYLKDSKEKFDVIIMDSTDPDGPSEKLYSDEHIFNMSKSLNEGGVICLQSECVWHSLTMIENLVKSCKKHFKIVKYATSNTPLYPFGQMGYLLCTNNTEINFKEPKYIMDPEKFKLKYYTPDIHMAAFVLPPFVEKAIYKD